MPRRLLLVLCALAGVAAVAAPVRADENDGPPSTLQQIKDGYDEAVAEEADALAAYEVSTAALADLRDKIAEADAAIAYVEGLLAEGERLLDEAGIARRRGVERLERREAELRREEDQLAEQAIEAFIGGTRPEDVAMEITLRAGSATEIQSGTEYSSVVLDGQRLAVERVVELREAAEVAAAELAELEAEAREARDAVAGFRSDLTAQREELLGLHFLAGLEHERIAAALAEVQSRRASYESRLQALRNDSDGVTMILQQRQRDQQLTPVIPTLRAPIENAQVSSGFGERFHPIFEESRRHDGIDMGGTMGAEIRAAADGVVAIAEERIGFGRVIVIDHGGQVATLYAHQSSFVVGVGDVVERGQVIGHVGSTGFSTGPHLHFEIRLSGLPVDPLPFVDFDEPLPGTCEALAASTDPADVAELASRPDCQAP